MEELIERLAQAAGCWQDTDEALYAFAALIAEECAKECEQHIKTGETYNDPPDYHLEAVAKAIRAKFKAEPSAEVNEHLVKALGVWGARAYEQRLAGLSEAAKSKFRNGDWPSPPDEAE